MLVIITASIEFHRQETRLFYTRKQKNTFWVLFCYLFFGIISSFVLLYLLLHSIKERKKIKMKLFITKKIWNKKRKVSKIKLIFPFFGKWQIAGLVSFSFDRERCQRFLVLLQLNDRKWGCNRMLWFNQQLQLSSKSTLSFKEFFIFSLSTKCSTYLKIMRKSE